MLRILNINDVSHAEYEEYYALLSAEKKARVDGFRFEKDKKRTVCGEMLARKMLAQCCGADAAEIVFDSDRNGKPYAKNVAAAFNISHSGDYVACAVSDRPVGVDIERMRTVEDSLVRYVCTETEARYVFEAQTQTDRQRRFFGIWTAKEAYVKWLGTGITDLKSVSVFDRALAEGLQRFFEGDYAVSIYQKQ